MAAMAEKRGGILKKRHRIAVVWRVANGGAMAGHGGIAGKAE